MRINLVFYVNKMPFYFCLLCLFVLLGPDLAHAYLDPGAGAGIIALIAGGFTGLVVIFQLGKDRLLQMFKGRSKPEEDEVSPSSYNDASHNRDRENRDKEK